MSQKLSPGSYVVGLKQSLKAISAGKALKVLLAGDADYRISSTVSDACLECEVELEISLSKSELGKMCSIDVDAAVVTILRY